MTVSASPRSLPTITILCVLGLVLLTAVGLAFSLDAQDEVAPPIVPTTRPFLWRLDAEVPSYFFGTMHVADPRVTTLPENVNQALREVDSLFTEIPMDGGNLARATSDLFLPSGKTVRDVLPPELYARLVDYYEQRGATIQMFERFQVWIIYQQLFLIEQGVSLQPVAPLDLQLWQFAGERGIERGGLETLPEQLAVFRALSDVQQVRLLEASLDDFELAFAEGRSVNDRWVELYLAGDTGALLAFVKGAYSEDVELTRWMELEMLTLRNVRMSDRITELIEGNPEKSYFFAIGAAHYPGKFGLINLLEAEDFELHRMLVDSPDEVAAPISEREVPAQG